MFFPPGRLVAQPQPDLCLAEAVIYVEISNGADRRVLLVLDDEPVLSPVATHVVPLKKRQKLSIVLRVRAVRVITPYFIIACPVEDVASVCPGGPPQVNSLAPHQRSVSV